MSGVTFIDLMWDSIADGIEINGDYNITGRQLRAIFTSYCIYDDIEADTMRCDATLNRLYNSIWADTTKVPTYTYEEFESFMIADII